MIKSFCLMVLTICTVLLFYVAPPSPLTPFFIKCLMWLWVIMIIYLLYPLLFQPFGVLILAISISILSLLLMPLSYKYQLLYHIAKYTKPLHVGLTLEHISMTGHFLMFFFLSLIAFHVFRQFFLNVLLVLLSASACLELLQNFAIGRQANIEDLTVNAMGVIIASCLFKIFSASLIKNDAEP